MDTPSVPDHALSSQVVVRALGLQQPFRWLARGAHDVMAAPGIALFYGSCFWGMALLIAWLFRARPEYVMSLASGCLLLGPFLALGLYDASQRLEAGQPPALVRSLTAWKAHIPSMSLLVLVLMVLELLWGRASLVVFAVFFNTGMPSTAGVLQAVFSWENWEFLAMYTWVGGTFAAIAFAATVVALPMILERDTDALTACITSARVVADNPGVMLLWGALITVLIGISLWAWGAGLLLTGPLLGCASWHAYRDAVEPAPRPVSAVPSAR